MAKKQEQAHVEYRHNGTGQFVETEWGKNHPKQTTREHVPNPGFGDVEPKKK